MEEKAIIVENQDSTVVGSYQANPNAKIFANEKELEEALIKQLTDGNLGYEKVHFSNCDELKANLRKQLEKLNNYQFSDEGWDNFLKTNWETHIIVGFAYKGIIFMHEWQLTKLSFFYN